MSTAIDDTAPTAAARAPEANGWLYDNEDTGREYSEDHPVESGEVPDATNIVPATAENLLAELKASWQAWNEDREELARMRNAPRDALVGTTGDEKTNVVVAWRMKIDAAHSDGYWHYYTTEPRHREEGEVWEPLYRHPVAEAVPESSMWETLGNLTFATQHNPLCPSPYLVRLPGKSGIIDMKPYSDGLGLRRHATGDILGFGKTMFEAAAKALAAKEEQRL